MGLASEGLAVLDSARNFTFVNESGAAILRQSRAELVGCPAVIFPKVPRDLQRLDRGTRGTTVDMASSGGRRRVEYTEQHVNGAVLIAFRDITEGWRRERQLSAFAQTASSIAYAKDLNTVLNEVAASVLDATGIPACTLVLVDPASGAIVRIGTAGGYPPDYSARLEACRRMGAPLMSLAAFTSARPVVALDWCQRVLADPRWEPVHDVLRGRDWGSLAAIPLTSKDGTIGGLTAFYPRGQDPTDGEVEFLSTIGEQVAVAVAHHKLMADMGSKAALEERHRIARDLHDSVSQALFSLTLQTRALELINENPKPGREHRVKDGLAELRNLTSLALAEMRALIFHLRPSALEEEGLVSAARKHCAAVAAREGMRIEVVSGRDSLSVPDSAATDLFHIIQEAVNNAVRHANAHQITVAFEQGHGLDVMICDDGEGFDLTERHGGHYGLATMAERAEALGGKLELSSRPGCTEVRVSITLTAAADE